MMCKVPLRLYDFDDCESVLIHLTVSRRDDSTAQPNPIDLK